jgi:propanediol dehydratase small subunit
VAFDPGSDYPLGTNRPDLVSTPGGLALADLTLEAVREGRLSPDEMRATPETLRRQAAVAAAAGRPQLAGNLERAAELALVPAETILEVYTALRPHRSTAADLASWADRLEADWQASATAQLVREAAAIYARRGLLAHDPGSV